MLKRSLPRPSSSNDLLCRANCAGSFSSFFWFTICSSASSLPNFYNRNCPSSRYTYWIGGTPDEPLRMLTSPDFNGGRDSSEETSFRSVSFEKKWRFDLKRPSSFSFNCDLRSVQVCYSCSGSRRSRPSADAAAATKGVQKIKKKNALLPCF